MMSLALLLAGSTAVLATTVAIVRVRHPSALSMLVFLAGWLAGELAVFHLVLQVIVTGILVGFGALEQTSGRIGLALMVISWVGLVFVQLRARRSREVVATALEPFAPDAAARVRAARTDPRRLARPFHFDKSGVQVSRDLAYGPHDAQRLDVYAPTAGAEGRPVMVYIHGGGWVTGKKEQQGLPMLHELTRSGWVCVAIDYRLGAAHRFPAQLEDVQLALRWVHDHIDAHGGDASFVAVSGGSAGGHLAALAALHDDSRSLVHACVPIYGAYDLTDHLDIRGSARMRPFLERMVMPVKQSEDPAFWEAMSPIFGVRDDAPPFLVLHGELDVLLWREEAAAFVERLAARSTAPVCFALLPGAQHAFDLFHSVRSAVAVEAIVAFCEAARTVRSR